mmetsp:Transcript_6645/g.14401  ORF Transcript_6645/g.14401 Transcript_6645/m.14401 type:complete len:344 (+) Transcript_6645:130-1161(+)
MGQSASKGLRKSAEAVAKKAAPSLKRPPIPSRGAPGAAQTPPPAPDNPGSFLRGEGIAAQDLRDRGQEMYLKHAQQQKQRQPPPGEPSASDVAAAAAAGAPAAPLAAPSSGAENTEMPEDLLRFIQDVGPAKQSVDREFTTTRLLKEENQDELRKAESVRTAKRERIRMPLMQGNEEFTTEKNTNFSASGDASKSVSAAELYDFGLSSLEMYNFLRRKEEGGETDSKSIEDFRESILTKLEEDRPSDEDSKAEPPKERELELLRHTLGVLEIPTLRMNADGDILGLYKEDVPGPEMTSIAEIPEDKAVLVLKDLSTNEHGEEMDMIGEKLKERVRERKSTIRA